MFCVRNMVLAGTCGGPGPVLDTFCCEAILLSVPAPSSASWKLTFLTPHLVAEPAWSLAALSPLSMAERSYSS